MAFSSEQLEPGRAAFNRGEYFLAHELWEEVWRAVGDADERRDLQGLIQIAAGLHHLQQHRTAPAVGLLRKGLQKLSPRRQDQLQVDRLAGQVARLLVELEAPGTEMTRAADFGHLKL
jgi:predicted metal-dependent hydrolase